jgi:hypothetical protein
MLLRLRYPFNVPFRWDGDIMNHTVEEIVIVVDLVGLVDLVDLVAVSALAALAAPLAQDLEVLALVV